MKKGIVVLLVLVLAGGRRRRSVLLLDPQRQGAEGGDRVSLRQ